MIPKHIISPFLILLLVSFSTDVSAVSLFRKLRQGSSSSSQDTRDQSDLLDPPPSPPKQLLPFPLRKKPAPPVQPITVTRRLEFWYRPGNRLLAVEIKGKLGGTEPPYMVEAPPDEECDPDLNTPETLNTVDAERMKPADLRQHNVQLIQKELVDARHAMYDERGKYKSGNLYVARIQELLDSMIHVLDSDRDPHGQAKYESTLERYKDVAKYRGCLPDEWSSYPLSSFSFQWENPKIVQVFDSRSCRKKNKCHDQTIGFSEQGIIGLSPPAIYRVCACAVLDS